MKSEVMQSGNNPSNKCCWVWLRWLKKKWEMCVKFEYNKCILIFHTLGGLPSFFSTSCIKNPDIKAIISRVQIWLWQLLFVIPGNSFHFLFFVCFLSLWFLICKIRRMAKNLCLTGLLGRLRGKALNKLENTLHKLVFI